MSVNYKDKIITQGVVPSRPMVLLMAQKNPILNHCLTMWQSGHISFERALMGAVLILAEESEQRIAELSKKISRRAGNHECITKLCKYEGCNLCCHPDENYAEECLIRHKEGE